MNPVCGSGGGMCAPCHMCDGQRTTCGVNSLLPLLCGFLGHQIYVASALPIEPSWEHILYVFKDLVASQSHFSLFLFII